MCLCECRLGKPASGKRFPGDLPVSAVESVSAAAPLPAVARLHLDLPLAHSSHHAGCGQYAYMYIHAFPCPPPVIYVTGTCVLLMRTLNAVRRLLSGFFMACVTGP